MREPKYINILRNNKCSEIIKNCEVILSGLENRDYGHRDPSRSPRDTFQPKNLALSSPTSGGRSVGIFRSQTQAAEFRF
jgi:hypothetical protein